MIADPDFIALRSLHPGNLQ
jgi:hypothetical protein